MADIAHELAGCIQAAVVVLVQLALVAVLSDSVLIQKYTHIIFVPSTTGGIQRVVRDIDQEVKICFVSVGSPKGFEFDRRACRCCGAADGVERIGGPADQIPCLSVGHLSVQGHGSRRGFADHHGPDAGRIRKGCQRDRCGQHHRNEHEGKSPKYTLFHFVSPSAFRQIIY